MRIAYKAFAPDLSCTSGGNRYQYRPGVWNEEPEANCAKNGFHCAENPLDCLSYYPEWDHAVYYMVLAAGDMDEDAHDSKISCTKLKLVKQLNKMEFVAHSLNYLKKYPYLQENRLVCKDKGSAFRGFVIVRGKAPKAMGQTGDILGFAKEEKDSKRIVEIGLQVVDGINILPDTLYSINGKRCSGKGHKK